VCSTQTLSSTAKNTKADSMTSDIEDFDDIITVLVGPEERRSSLHKPNLCNKSRFFEAACSKRWIEGQKKIVSLPEVRVDLFRKYCEWVYSDRLPSNRCNMQSEPADLVEEQDMIIGLYLLGDSLDDLRLRGSAIKAMTKSMSAIGFPVPDHIATVWSSTPSGSLFRKALVDFIISRDRGTFVSQIATYPPEFLQEVAIGALRRVAPKSWKDTFGDGSRFLEPDEPNNSTA
jgi:hypothetical protein